MATGDYDLLLADDFDLKQRPVEKPVANKELMVAPWVHGRSLSNIAMTLVRMEHRDVKLMETIAAALPWVEMRDRELACTLYAFARMNIRSPKVIG